MDSTAANSLLIRVGHGEATTGEQRFPVWLGEELLGRFRLPFCSAARLLVERGHDPEALLEMERDGVVALRGRLGEAATLTVGKGATTFSRYKPRPTLETNA